MIDITGWLGNIFIIGGIIMVAYRWRSGFVLGILGNSLWCLQGIITKQWDLTSLEVVIVVLQAFSWWNWGRTNVESTNGICSRSN